MLGFAKIIALSLLFVFFLNLNSQVLATDHTLVPEDELKSLGFESYESINPNLLIFPIKRIIEDIKFKLIFSKEAGKEKYQYSLLETRFKELVFIINFQKTGFLREATGRYNNHLGTIISSGQDIPPQYKEKLSFYIKVLKSLQDRYNSESAYRFLIQESIDTTRRLI